jgi:PilZ domain-containing protein
MSERGRTRPPAVNTKKAVSVSPPMAPAAPKGAEHRKDERRSFSGPITVVAEIGKDDVQTRAIDLSAGGCFFITPIEFEVGEVIALSIELPGRPALKIFGTVAHRRPAKGGIGYGIQFADLAPDERDVLAESCKSLPPQVPAKPKRVSLAPTKRA